VNGRVVRVKKTS